MQLEPHCRKSRQSHRVLYPVDSELLTREDSREVSALEVSALDG